ncbi:SET domain-containing protein 3 [Elsinoe fawcettii]|nr:SET domain-containing protein 3 [Elsinoe fawcettii]
MPSRATKRQKTNVTSAIDPKHSAFSSWATQRGITINGVEPASIPGRGIGLVTNKKIKEGDVLVHVPTDAMIKPQPDLFDKEAEKAGPLPAPSPQARLAATLMHMESSEDEAYRTCSSVWPTADDFESSLFWYGGVGEMIPQPLRDSMPTAMRTASTRLVQDFNRDLSSLQALKETPFANITAESFVYFWTIANTRSFAWKPQGRKEGIMVMCPFLDYMNHCSSGEGCGVSMSEDGYTLTANRDYEFGEEILATYGAHSNDKLLVHYGFTLPDSADDVIQLDGIIMPQLSKSDKQDLESVGYLGNYTLFPSTNEICFRTQVALRVRCTTSNEWEYFMNSGDDIGADMDDKIKLDLATMIQGSTQSRELDLGSLKTAAEHAVKPTLRSAIEQIIQRHHQITSALTAFRSI